MEKISKKHTILHLLGFKLAKIQLIWRESSWIKIVKNVGQSTFKKCDKSLTIAKMLKIIDLKIIKNNQNLDCAKIMIFQNENIKNLK